MAMTRVLITGNTGFIAGQLFQWLAREYAHVDVYGFDRAHGQELMDGDAVEEAVRRVDYVFHLGALTHVHQSIETPIPFIQQNVYGTVNVLEACRKYGKGLTLVSSSEVYGTSQCEPAPMPVTHPIAPHSPYGASKACQDRMAYAWHQTYGLDVRIVRPFNQYGPGQDVRKVIPRFMYLMLQGKPMSIHGDGTGTRDYVWVQDTASGIWMSQFAPAGSAMNLGTGLTWSTVELAEIIRRTGEKLGVTSYAGTVHVGTYDEARWGHVYCLRGSTEEARNLCGWEPTTQLEEGIEKTWKWVLGNGPSFYRGGELRSGLATHAPWEDGPNAGRRPSTF